MNSLQRIGAIISIVAGAIAASIGTIQLIYWLTYAIAANSINDVTSFYLIVGLLAFIISVGIIILGVRTISANRSNTAWGLVLLSVVGPFGLGGLVAVVAVGQNLIGFDAGHRPPSFIFVMNGILMALMVLSLIGGVIAIVGARSTRITIE